MVSAAIDGLTLYELAGADADVRFSPHCWKTRFALAHKGLEAGRLPWRFCEKEAIAFSGQGLVPVMIHGETTVSDSWRIALYLEETFPDRPSLFGSSNAVPLTHFINSWGDTTLLPALARIILVDVFDCLDDRDRAYFRQSREARFGMSLEDVVADRAKHLAAFRNALVPLRRTIEQQAFLAGAAPAYADYCVFGMFMWPYCTSSVELLEANDPLVAWRERMLDLFGGLARSALTGHPSGR